MSIRPSGTLRVMDEYDKQLAIDIGSFHDDPLGFIMYVFPWGTGELKDHTGPDKWQRTLLNLISTKIKEKSTDSGLDTALRIAVASGHGVGKTALTSWLILWFLSTRPNCQIVCTANTQSQLTTKSWRELAKWHRMALNRSWFIWTATKLYHTLYAETWFASATPWSKDNSEAFAGTHADDVMILFDEASAIDASIWDTVEGALTTTGSMFFCFGNPTQTSGKFHEAFHSMSHRWTTYHVDSRDAKMANQAQIKEWLEDYGEDSDFFKIRVKGEFPRQSASQFIPADVVFEATKRNLRQTDYAHYPYIIGVDVARYGLDQSIIIVRQGMYVSPPLPFRSLDVMELSGKVVEQYRKFPAGRTIVCVDGVGIGAGLVDRLKQLGLSVIDVQSGEKPFDIRTYANKRAENWGRMKDALISGLCIPPNKDLEKQLTSLEYCLNKRLQILLQSKEDIRKHGGVSPDMADALAFTFAYDEAKVLATSAKARVIKQVNWA